MVARSMAKIGIPCRGWSFGDSLVSVKGCEGGPPEPERLREGERLFSGVGHN